MTGEIVVLKLNRSTGMTPEEFKAAVKAAGFKTQAEFAEYVDMNVRTVNDWGSQNPKSGRLGPPVVIVRLLNRMASRGRIARASIKPTVEEAVAAISPAVSDLMGEATLMEFPPAITAAALIQVGQMYERAEREGSEQAHAKTA